jgi:hypothetical protein
MEGTEHLNKVIKKALDHTNHRWAATSKKVPYECGNDSWIQVLRFLRHRDIIALHDIPTTRKQKRET